MHSVMQPNKMRVTSPCKCRVQTIIDMDTDTITINANELHSFAVRIAQIAKDELLKELRSAGMILSENEAREYRKLKATKEPLIKQHDAALMLGVSDQTIMRMKDRGELPFVVISGGRVRYRTSDVAALKK